MLFTFSSSFLFSASIRASLSSFLVVVAAFGPGIRVPFDRTEPPPPPPPEAFAVPSELVPRAVLPGSFASGFAGFCRGELACGLARPVVVPVLAPGAVLGF
jgi:hypothetical protein